MANECVETDLHELQQLANQAANDVFRKFGICRICFRKLADQGLIPGVKKSSW